MVLSVRGSKQVLSDFCPPLVVIWGAGPETCRRIRALATERQLPMRFLEGEELERGQFADIALTPAAQGASQSLRDAIRAVLAATVLRPGEWTRIGKWRAVRLAASVRSNALPTKVGVRFLTMPDGGYAIVAGATEWRTWSAKLAKRVLRWLKRTKFAEALLIVGPTGTGKTLLAKLVHETTAHKAGKLVRVGTEILRSGLLQTELFGTIAGAYTGAPGNQPGLVEVARGGTLLIDELDAFPQGKQPILYRFLDTREFERLGSEDTRTAPCTIIVCCNRPLSSLLETEELTLQLFERLAGKRIVIPPLRKRKKDIVGFLCYQLARLAIQTGKRFRFTKRALLYLLSLQWEGNVRELTRTVRALGAVSETGVVDLADVLAVVQEGRLSDAVRQAAAEGRPLHHVTRVIDRFLLLRAIVNNYGNVSAAAREISLPRDAFYRKAAECGLDLDALRKYLRKRTGSGRKRKGKQTTAGRENDARTDGDGGERKGAGGSKRKKKEAGETRRKRKPKSESKGSSRRKGTQKGKQSRKRNSKEDKGKRQRRKRRQGDEES